MRLLFFVVPFGIVYWLGLQLQFSLPLAGGVAAVIAALFSMALSMLVLSRPREQAAQSIVDWRNRDRTADDIAEDAVLDGDAEDAVDAATEAAATPAAEVAGEAEVAAEADSAATPSPSER
nr:DUF4229 domain-containing protein [Leucobacter exalbidus]